MIDSSVAPSGITPRLMTSPASIDGKRTALNVLSTKSAAGSVRTISLVWYCVLFMGQRLNYYFFEGNTALTAD